MSFSVFLPVSEKFQLFAEILKKFFKEIFCGNFKSGIHMKQMKLTTSNCDILAGYFYCKSSASYETLLERTAESLVTLRVNSLITTTPKPALLSSLQLNISAKELFKNSLNVDKWVKTRLFHKLRKPVDKQK